VELWAEEEPNQFSSTVNTGDVNGTAFVQTPETGGLNTDPAAFCLWFSNASYTIRWDDNTPLPDGIGRLAEPGLHAHPGFRPQAPLDR
jgi:hypothetical protein